jgi:alpha-ketoglutarate-dependent taurine dioxygenase
MSTAQSAVNSISAQVSISEPPALRGAVMVCAGSPALVAADWVRRQQSWLLDVLRSQGAVVLRGFAPIQLEQFEEIAALAGEGPPLPYQNRSTPRSTVKGNIYTSTEYPPSEAIPLHSENSYSSQWPARILFLCVQPSAKGGETPIADNRRVYASIPAATRELFESKGVTYVRNYGDLGLSWQETFQTQKREDVEAYCADRDLQLQWGDEARLRTQQTLPASRKHPTTGEVVWFNQAHLFHVSNLGEVGDELIEILGKQNLPRNAVFGDGSDIAPEQLQAVRNAYEEHAVPLGWQANDLVVLDNMLWAHGRLPFAGPRRVLVAMTGTLSG